MENRQIEINPVTAILVILEFLFVIIMITSFQNLFADDVVELGVEISGAGSTLGFLPEDEKTVLEHYIYETIAKNAKSYNVGEDDVVVRDGSVVTRHDEELNVDFVNFIVDVPETGQMYRVVDEWSDDLMNEYISPNDPVYVMCLSESCEGDEGVAQKVVSRNLERHGYVLPEDNAISALPDDAYAETESKAIKLNYMACGTQCECRKVGDEEKQTVITTFREFVESFGFSLEDVEYYFSNC